MPPKRPTTAATEPQETEPKDQLPLRNPTELENWPEDPNTLEELEDWIQTTRNALLEWLKDARLRADEDAGSLSTRRIRKHNRRADQDWAKWETQTYVETGEAIGRAIVPMKIEMDKQAGNRKDLHKGLITDRRHDERRWAQAAWEDLLYYQNVWNRKNFDPNDEFYVTKLERQYEEAKKKKTADEETQNSNAGRRTAGVKPQANTIEQTYIAWRNHMIQLYTNFKLGYRKRMPEVVGPEIAHRYSQPPRETINQTPPQGKLRHEHLEERFPRKRRKVLDPEEVEEIGPKDENERITNARLDAEFGTEPIQWRLDDEAYETSRKKRIGKRKVYLTDSAAMQESHERYHGSTETSSQFSTSFDSPAWGNQVATTIKRKTYIYEKVPNANSISDEDAKYKKEVKGNKIKLREPTRHKQLKKVHGKGREPTEQVFIHYLNEDGRVKGRDRTTGKWPGHWEQRKKDEYEFEMTRGHPTPLPPRYQFRNEFEVHMLESDVPVSTRPERLKKAGREEELSEWEDDEGPGEGAHPGDDPDDPEDPDDGEESDDEGDEFAGSYKQCSGTAECPVRRRAREIKERLTRKLGENPIASVPGIISLLDHGSTEEEIELEWPLQVKIVRRWRQG